MVAVFMSIGRTDDPAITGAPGPAIWWTTTPASDSAADWASTPASVIGPAMPGKMAG